MKTIINMFEESVNRFPDNIYLWQKKDGKFSGSTYSDVRRSVHEFGAGLMHLGLKKGDRVTLLSEGRNEWVIAELGILYNGGINVPLSIKLNEPEEIAFRLKHSGSRMAIASSRQIDKIINVWPSLKELELIICLDKIETGRRNVLFYSDIAASGRKLLDTKAESFRERYMSITDDDYANICYTSGTTTDPKGIILSHRNYTSNIEHSCSLHTIPEDFVNLLILPWDHSFAHTCGIYSKMKYGASLASVESGSTALETLKNIPKNIKEIRPNLLLSVPALAKNFRKNIEKAIADKGNFTQKLFNFALRIGYFYNGNGWNRGKGYRALLFPFYRLFDAVIFKKVREGFGGRLEFFVGGGALLDIELQRFFAAIGIPMYQGYGLTEASPVISSNNKTKFKMGSSGIIASGVVVRILDEDGNEMPTGKSGEIVVQGENVMKGYWNNEKATAETLKNGWLYTGDLGYIDEDGFLFVLGRFKSLLIADDGEKFSPEGIEEALINNSGLIDQCMLHNNQKPYSVCLLVVNREAVKRQLSAEGKDGDVTYALKLFEREIDKYKKGGEYSGLFPERWLPAAIGILEEGFTEENKLMNSTMKIVRPKITEKYQKLLDLLYSPQAKNIDNERNREVMGKLLS